MGKTKTIFVEGKTEEKKSGKEAYEAKMLKRAQAAEALSDAEKPKVLSEVGGKKKPGVQTKDVQDTAKPEAPAVVTEKIKIGKDKAQIKGMGLKGGERIKIVGAEIPEDTKEETYTRTGSSEEEEAKEKRIKKAKIRSKNYKSARSKVDKNKLYKIADALKLLKDIKYSKFDETLELHLVTKSKGLNFNVSLPYSGGKEKRIEIADDKTVDKLKNGKVDFDILLATADMMPKLVPFARMLGPKGLMPNPKNGTLIKSKKDAEKFSGNSLTLKTEKEQPVIHTVIGKLSQKDAELEENTKAVFDGIGGSKQIIKAYIKSTMSPSVKLQVA